KQGQLLENQTSVQEKRNRRFFPDFSSAKICGTVCFDVRVCSYTSRYQHSPSWRRDLRRRGRQPRRGDGSRERRPNNKGQRARGSRLSRLPFSDSGRNRSNSRSPKEKW